MDKTELTEAYRKSAEKIVSDLHEAYRADNRRRIRELEDEIDELEQKAKWDQITVTIRQDTSVKPYDLGVDGNERAFVITVE